TRATARLHRDTQPEVVATLLGEQRAHLGRGTVGEDDPLRGLLLNSHLSSRLVSCAALRRRLALLQRAIPTICGAPAFQPPPEAWLTAGRYRPGAPQTGNHRARSGSHFRSSPITPLTSSSSALFRRSPDSGANG